MLYDDTCLYNRIADMYIKKGEKSDNASKILDIWNIFTIGQSIMRSSLDHQKIVCSTRVVIMSVKPIVS